MAEAEIAGFWGEAVRAVVERANRAASNHRSTHRWPDEWAGPHRKTGPLLRNRKSANGRDARERAPTQEARGPTHGFWSTRSSSPALADWITELCLDSSLRPKSPCGPPPALVHSAAPSEGVEVDRSSTYSVMLLVDPES